MSKKNNRFSRSSGWHARPGGAADKGAESGKARADVSQGSQRMADGATQVQPSR